MSDPELLNSESIAELAQAPPPSPRRAASSTR